MDAKIKEWILLARKIGKRLLASTEIIEEGTEDLRSASPSMKEIPSELRDFRYYVRKAAHRQELNKKYTWDEFLRTQQSKARHRRLKTWGYAASIIILIGVASTVWLNQRQPEAQIPFLPQPELIAGSTKASLVLSDGQEIALNDRLTLTEKDGTLIENKESGELAYQADNSPETVLQYNTLRVPRGGEYRLVLPDGTKVWVNSESELRFPTRFAADKRDVFLKGEAYFEIAHDASHPFFVHSDNLQIHATGTAFNVMAYQDEPELKVMLVEGGVNIEKQSNLVSKLKPDHEFSINRANGEFRVAPVDIRTATAWKNGLFFFNDEPLGSIVRKLSRWYDIDIQCVLPELNQYKFSGTIRKYENADEVLNMLKLTNEITYKVQPDKKVMIYAAE